MADCPFCHKDISEDLSRFGGACPKCLINIPGEETATDPGVDTGFHRRAAQKSRTPLIAGVVVVLVCMGAGGTWWMRSTPTVSRILRKGADPIPLSAHEDQPYETEPQVDVVSEEATTSYSASRSSSSRVSTPGPEKQADQGAIVPPSEKSVAGLGAAPEDVFSTISAAPIARGPKGIVLSDPGQIEAMIRRVLDRAGKQFKQCYEQRIRTAPSLRGAWRVDLTVTKEGSASAVQIVPMAVRDSGMESCMRSHTGDLNFQQLEEPIAVSRTFRFGA